MFAKDVFITEFSFQGLQHNPPAVAPPSKPDPGRRKNLNQDTVTFSLFDQTANLLCYAGMFLRLWSAIPLSKNLLEQMFDLVRTEVHNHAYTRLVKSLKR